MVGASVQLEAAMLTHAFTVLEHWHNDPVGEVTPAVEEAWDILDQAALAGLFESGCEEDDMAMEMAWECAFDPE